MNKKGGSEARVIADRLSLRPPQRWSLEILDRVTEIVPLRKDTDVRAALAAVRAEFPDVTDFERDFPSLCFALATGVGKTRLMAAFVAYLHRVRGVRNFFVLAPSLTVYDKLITDFTPGTPKYVLAGIAEFAQSPPTIITGDTYERGLAAGGRLFPVAINIFNIAKINIEVRSGRPARIRGFREELGESYFDYLAGMQDLVLIMDEAHRYRASAGVRVLNELRPVLGLELTATPYVEEGRARHLFKNVAFTYPLGRAVADGYVKEPAVVTRENFVVAGHSDEALQRIKLEDGISLHESIKVTLEAYAREADLPLVKPFMLIIARDTDHAATLMQLIKSDQFFDGRYGDKVIQVDSTTVHDEEETVERLLKVEHADEPTEIVIHVNMLKEGWDVKNLYTIVPLRPAHAFVLAEQSLGRGLRLPYGRRTGVKAIDRLNIVAHDTFQAIVEAARRLNAPVSIQCVALTENELQTRMATVVALPRNVSAFGSIAAAASPYAPGGFQEAPESLIAIPQIVMKPACAAKWTFCPFALDLTAFRYGGEMPMLRASYLRSGEIDRIDIDQQEAKLGSAEDMIVSRLVAFDDVAYQNCADLLYDLAKQVTAHLSVDHSCVRIKKLVALYQTEIAREIHAQMLRHVSREGSAAPEPIVVRPVTPLRPIVYTAPAGAAPRDFRLPSPDAARIAGDLFGGFTSCLFDIQKFHSDSERRLAVILERERVPWFRPARSQFGLAYMLDGVEYDYVPDFVVGADDQFLMIEVKAANELTNADVLAKAAAGIAWCRAAAKDAATRGGKGWAYILIPHDAIAENMTLAGLVGAYWRS